MCDVPSIAVFCSESIECFPGIASKFFLKLLVTITVAPIITGIIVLLLLLLLYRVRHLFSSSYSSPVKICEQKFHRTPCFHLPPPSIQQ
jgi:hypothetical protein